MTVGSLADLDRLIGAAVVEHHRCAEQQFAERLTSTLLAARPRDDSARARAVSEGLEIAVRVARSLAGLPPSTIPAGDLAEENTRG